jgi:hypothetical protein
MLQRNGSDSVVANADQCTFVAVRAVSYLLLHHRLVRPKESDRCRPWLRVEASAGRWEQQA